MPARPHGISVKAWTWLGRTTVKWWRSTVAISPMFNRSAVATTDASTVPRGQVAVQGGQLNDAQPIGGNHGLDAERAACEVAEEAHFGFRTETITEQVGNLGDDEHGDDQRAGVRFEKLQRWHVVGVVGVDVRIKRPRVDNKRTYRKTSAARISSIRSEMSVRPLRPAAAARRLRRPRGSPKYASSASRLISEIDILRCSAS